MSLIDGALNWDCPHARGGEPLTMRPNILAPSIVPTPVGVNRARTRIVNAIQHCPHARGGEPPSRSLRSGGAALSPRPWG